MRAATGYSPSRMITVSLQVSWIRLRDWHILSTGPSTFTQDERFTVRHTPGGNDWTLAIKFVNQRDQGKYVCQVRGAAEMEIY